MQKFDEFFKYLESFGIEFSLRQKNLESWSQSLNSLGYIPVEYTSSWIDYNLLYLSEDSEILDLSILIYSGGKICGLWPLIGRSRDDVLSISGPAQEILPPIFFESTSRKLKKRIYKGLLKTLSAFNENTSKKYFVIQHRSLESNPSLIFSDWYKQAMDLEATADIRHDLYLDLSKTDEEIKSNFRKSYKPLINKGLQEWECKIISSNNPDKTYWEDFRKFHHSVAGRVTRSINTWNKQFEMITAGEAFLVLLFDKDNEDLVGGSFFQVNKFEGFYAVAAYDRNLFDKPLGHVAQYLAINHMKSLNIKWYKLGEKLYLHNDDYLTKKEIDISLFKEGFSSNMVPRLHLKIPLKG